MQNIGEEIVDVMFLLFGTRNNCNSFGSHGETVSKNGLENMFQKT